MNFKHVLILVAILIVGIVAFQFFTRTDHSDPIAVADAFTAEIKDGNFEAASEYVAPGARAAWLEATNKRFEDMRSGSMENYFESIPEEPGFKTADPARGAAAPAAGTMSLVSADQSYAVEMAQVEGDWYVAKAPN